mmetsp:Transcript_18927/g.48415  ORF Transcript_18927/g.48415 Transcript_18927/m.48415 type:complete len:91 (-) Transcript_18927:75-347(-)
MAVLLVLGLVAVRPLAARGCYRVYSKVGRQPREIDMPDFDAGEPRARHISAHEELEDEEGGGGASEGRRAPADSSERQVTMAGERFRVVD